MSYMRTKSGRRLDTFEVADRTDALRAMRALKTGLPSRQRNTGSPVVTLSSAVDAATPTNVPAWDSTNNVLSTKFRFTGRGPGQYIQASRGFPDSAAVRQLPLPASPAGFGGFTVEFWSDAPQWSIQAYRSYGGTLRVICDDVEILRSGVAVAAGTAQAGAAGTITLAAAASGFAGFYNGYYVRITGGTGAGQVAQIEDYNQTTKVATVSPAWTTTPDATSTYEVTQTRQQFTTSTQSGNTVYWHKIDWTATANPREMRRYRVEGSGIPFYGINVTRSRDVIRPTAQPGGVPIIFSADSFGVGVGGDANFLSMARLAADRLGGDLRNISIGGAGYLNPNSAQFSMTARDRMLPPANAWFVHTKGSTAGGYTLTQAGTTVTVAYNDTITAIQTKLDTAFGAGKFTAHGDSASFLWVLGRGTNAATAAAMTINTAGLTIPAGLGGVITRWTGDLELNVPRDGDGNVLPFVLILGQGHNDSISSSAAYTQAALQAEVSTLLQQLYAKYGALITIFVIGAMYLPAAAAGSDVAGVNAGILAACTTDLKKINGKSAFIETLATRWFTGSGRIGAPSNDGTSDFACWSDATHPSSKGHEQYGEFIAEAVLAIAAPA